MKSKKKNKLVGLVMSGMLVASIGASSVAPVFAYDSSWGNGKYYSSFNSYTELLEEVGEVNLQTAEEGQVLLKNDGTLPLTGKESVSIFGVASAKLINGQGTGNDSNSAFRKYTDFEESDKGSMYDSLDQAGFNVNPTLAEYYAEKGFSTSDCGNETSSFSNEIESSLNLYNDVGVIVLSRFGNEGSDLDMVTDEVEDNEYLGEDSGYTHEALYKGSYAASSGSSSQQMGGPPGMGGSSYDIATTSENYNTATGTEYKHYLELTESEEDLISYVKDHCKKIIVVLNTSNAMECYNLREDPDINGILLMGRGGENGYLAVGEILAGLVNPSGKLVDEWNTDFTADPTWNNYGYNVQTGSENAYYYGTYGTTLTTYGGNGDYDDYLTRTAKDGSTVTTSQTVYGTHNASWYYGTDYEEDIYLGYAYWETKYYEIYQALLKNASVTYVTNGGTRTINRATTEASVEANAAKAANEWWEKNVTFAFGSGLSYTSFSFNIDQTKIYATGGALESEDEQVVADFDISTDMTKENLESSEGKAAKVKTLYIPVTVTNTGKVAGKETVEIYITAPYGDDAKLEKSFVTLSGYAKSEIINPGQSQTVWVKVNVQDMASYDYSDAYDVNETGYTFDVGDYTIRAMNTSHYDVATNVNDTTDAYDEVNFTLAADSAATDGGRARLRLDDFSGNLSTALFSEDYATDETATAKVTDTNNWAEDTDEDHYQIYNSLRTKNLMADGTSEEVLLTRNTILTYFPETPTKGDMVFSTSYVDHLEYWNNFSAADDTDSDDWAKTYADCVDSAGNKWKQGTGVADATTGRYSILLSDMTEEQLYDENGKMTVAWSNFMNQLTVDEMTKIIRKSDNMWRSTALETVGKAANQQKDSYNNNGNTFSWVDAPTITATWNTDLAYKIGQVRGNLSVYNGWSAWGGPEMDTHRSPFSGRNFEYLSQDGLLGGYIAAGLTSGMQSKGVTCYIKHFVLNDQETCRDGMENMVWLSEQNFRQNYLKVFQMAMQEGGSKSAMTGFARISGIPTSSNNQLLENLVVDQWGWEGMYITDGYSGFSRCTTMASMMRSYVVPLPLNKKIPGISGRYDSATGKFYAYTGAWDKELYENDEAKKDTQTKVGINDEGVEETSTGYWVGTEVESPTQWYYLRNLAARILQVEAHSLNNLNGHSVSTLPTLTEAELTLTQGTEANVSLAIEDAAANCYTTTTNADGSTTTTENFTAEYEYEGTLPAGVSFDSATGKISGTPTEAGTFTIKVSVTLDGWVNTTLVNDDNKSTNANLTKSYTITVNSGFSLVDGKGTAVSNDVKAGGTVAAQISSTTITAGENETLKYSDTTGELAKLGLTLSETDGTITGTVASTAVNGAHDIVIKVTKSTQSSNQGGQGGQQGGWPGGGGWGGGNSSTEYTYKFTLNVSGGAEEAAEAKTVQDIVKNTDGSMTVTYTDGTTSTIAATNTADSGTTTESDSGCNSSVSALQGILIAVPVLAAAAVVVALKRKGKND